MLSLLPIGIFKVVDLLASGNFTSYTGITTLGNEGLWVVGVGGGLGIDETLVDPSLTTSLMSLFNNDRLTVVVAVTAGTLFTAEDGLAIYLAT